MNSTDPLSQLRDIHLPPEIGWWPLAPGWWALLTLIILALVAGAFWFMQRRNRNRYRREALQQLAESGATSGSTNQLQQTVLLLRRTAQTAYGETRPVSLATREFLNFLAGKCNRTVFSTVPENIDQLLFSAATQADKRIVESLQSDARTWIKHHRRDRKC